MGLVENVRNAGVVGAGGAGFPTHVKLTARVKWLLVNGAECEPLLHKDRELMTHFADDIVSGLKLASNAVQALNVAVGIKAKNRDAIEAMKKSIGQEKIDIEEFGDFYPAGDEYELVYKVTGKLIPPQGIPLDVDSVVNNVETLYNIHRANQGIPVTEKFLTISGLVQNPITTKVPIGMLVEDVLKLAGGPTIDDFAVMDSGVMMGKLIEDYKTPITKTSGGLIVLPADHNLIQRYNKPQKVMDRIGHSACDQCSYCTELCPRYLLGYDIQPHLVMRSLGFSLSGSKLWNEYAMLCCQCGLCTLYACPEALYPREACVRGINDLKAIDKTRWEGPKEVKAHPLKEDRRIPMKHLMNRLGITKYESHAGYVAVDCQPERVYIKIQQHIGAPASPVVKTGDVVEKGQVIANVDENQLGAPVHASINGQIEEIRDSLIVIKRN